MRHAVLLRIDGMLLLMMVLLRVLLRVLMGPKMLLVEALSVRASVLDVLNMRNEDTLFWMFL